MAEAMGEPAASRSWGRGAIATAVCLIIVLLPPAPATSSGGKKRLDIFAGSCEFKGSVRFTPPLAPAEQATHAEALASGPCTGTWRSRKGIWRLDGDEVLYKARSDGTQSCSSADAAGEGLLKYRGKTLRFRFSESRFGTSAPIRLEGVRGGLFTGTATAEGDPAEVVQQCLTDGVGEAAVTISGASEPKVSG